LTWDCAAIYNRRSFTRAFPVSTIPFSFTEGGFDVNKNDLITTVSNKTDLSKADAAAAIDGVFDAISEVLTGGGEVRLVGFGTFSITNRRATEGRNPRTGEKIQIPASKQPKFKAGKGLKDAVNNR
jgi:DNA-binding protein HU-beta